jgi:ligand-binding SRPBCC domain-containing protein
MADMTALGNNTSSVADKRAAQIVECSCLAASPEVVWSRVKTMKGVNAELMPFLLMTYPAAQNALDGRQLKFGVPLFRSVLLMFGIIPMDLHTLVLESLTPDRGFRERSSSLLQREWMHERTLEHVEEGTRITDRVVFCCRLPALNFAFRPVVRFIFRHRHRRLRQRFGQLHHAPCLSPHS